ncbi:MAG TPA: hypothetical protein VJ521_16670, partial [Acidobacteriota bacterium]|nr:hypothetical protein [Acidobacteriota bacterium]
MRWREFSFSVVAIIVLVSCGWAQEEFPKLTLSGVLDARLVKTDEGISWLEGGLGKVRYGNGDDKLLARLSQASLLLSIAASEQLSGRIHINVDAEPNDELRGGRVDIIEAFASYRPVLSPYLRLRLRGGLFFPPVSLENTGRGWTTPYTITTSAINSWIGEEVRATGAEGSLVFALNSNELTITAAAFGNNDPTGSLLAWRGWSLHDRQSGLSDRVPLAAIPAVEEGGLFAQQPRYVDPLREIDGRIGYYTAVGWERSGIELRALYVNNRGEQTLFDGSQYAWKTDFVNLGAHISLPKDLEILSQFLAGTSRMGPGSMAYIDFYSTYVLASVAFDRNRLSLRYDDFRVHDNDHFRTADNNEESGS